MEEADQVLLEAFRQGDERALAVLLERQAPMIYRFGVRMCRDPEDARDVVQETLLAAARGLRDFRGASSLSTWFYSVARSFCIKQRRRSSHAPAGTLSLDEGGAMAALAAPGAAPDDVAAGRELGAALEKAIAALDPLYREVLLLRDVEGLTAPEVAEIVGASVDAVKSRLHRARAEVRGALDEFFPESERTTGRRPAAVCPDIVALFSRYTDGEIGPDECAAMEDHIRGCKRCDAACKSLKHTLSVCRGHGHGEVPPDVQELVRDAVRRGIAAARPGAGSPAT